MTDLSAGFGTRGWQRGDDGPSRPICTFFAMGGCSKGERCPYSHALVQHAPEGVDVSGGFYVSGNVANYKATLAASITAAVLPSPRSGSSRCDDAAASSSTEGLSTLVSPSSCCATTGTSLSAEAKEWVTAESAATSSCTNFASGPTASARSLPSNFPVATRLSSTSPRCSTVTLTRSTSGFSSYSAQSSKREVRPLLHNAKQPPLTLAPSSQPPQPRSATSAPRGTAPFHRADAPGDMKVAAPTVTVPRSTEAQRSTPAARPPRFPAPPSRGSAPITTFGVMHRVSGESSESVTVEAAAPIEQGFFAWRGDGGGAYGCVVHPSTPPTVSVTTASPPVGAFGSFASPPRYTAVSTCVAYPTAAVQPSTSAVNHSALALVTVPPAESPVFRIGARDHPAENLFARTRDVSKVTAELRSSALTKEQLMQSATTASVAPVASPYPPQYETKTAATTHTRVMPPAPRSQQQQQQQLRTQQESQQESPQEALRVRAQQESQQLRLRQEALRQSHVQPPPPLRVPHEPNELVARQMVRLDLQQQERRLQRQSQPQPQQQPVYAVTSAHLPAASAPPQEVSSPSTHASFGYPTSCSLISHKTGLRAATPVLVAAEQPVPSHFVGSLISSFAPQPSVQNFPASQGPVLYAAPAHMVSHLAGGRDSDTTRLLLVKPDGTYTVLHVAAVTSSPATNRPPTFLHSN